MQRGQPKGTVQVYSGSCYAERPRAFVWQGRPYHVAEVARQWRTPAGMCFVVAAQELGGASGLTTEDQAGEAYPISWWMLMYDEARDHWYIRRTTRKSF